MQLLLQLFPAVRFQVSLETVKADEGAVANIALVWLLSTVPHSVDLHVVLSIERLSAEGTFVKLGVTVRQAMSLQLVQASKFH